MKREKGICLLLLICRHALVGAELRGTTAKMGDHELKSKPMESSLGEHSFPNTRTLQTGLCSAIPACVYVLGGVNNIPPYAMCCPTAEGVTMTCCGTAPAPTIPAPTLPDNRDDGSTGGQPTIPVSVPTVPAPAPTVPAPAPTIPVSAAVPAASCTLFPACVSLAGGADGLNPGSMCCPTPYGHFLSCCYADE